ncbi:unknown protein [Seminavis robusta]|uniref:Uncharacterized protein n=1 Tax=Seminavis robusta TaxID=568900 RepID=A0A9N8I0A4_9STRA|nr:unknown protein [Seminavis robusta]|eukprot:Sro2597_g332170.1 n/a (240) ;mRNA; f:9494-10417
MWRNWNYLLLTTTRCRLQVLEPVKQPVVVAQPVVVEQRVVVVEEVTFELLFKLGNPLVGVVVEVVVAGVLVAATVVMVMDVVASLHKEEEPTQEVVVEVVASLHKEEELTQEVCEEAGFINNIFRDKGRYLTRNIVPLFGREGPFHGYNPVSAAVFGQRITAAERYFRELLTNHNNDPTGAEGEERPIWFPVMTRYRQFCDSNPTRGGQANQAQQKDIAVVGGGAQRPLGAGWSSSCSE